MGEVITIRKFMDIQLPRLLLRIIKPRGSLTSPPFYLIFQLLRLFTSKPDENNVPRLLPHIIKFRGS